MAFSKVFPKNIYTMNTPKNNCCRPIGNVASYASPKAVSHFVLLGIFETFALTILKPSLLRGI